MPASLAKQRELLIKRLIEKRHHGDIEPSRQALDERARSHKGELGAASARKLDDV